VLELAGSVAALDPIIIKGRADVLNNSNASAGVLVSGTHQQVGGIDGDGTTQVNAGSDLTANHVVQSALVIGGAAGSPGLVTIDASDASGNPLSQSSGFALAGSLTPSDPFGADGSNSAKLNVGSVGGADLATLSPRNSDLGSNASAVPEPSTLVLMLIALSSVVGQRIAQGRRARRNGF
jgi:hypothetical protein